MKYESEGSRSFCWQHCSSNNVEGKASRQIDELADELLYITLIKLQKHLVRNVYPYQFRTRFKVFVCAASQKRRRKKWNERIEISIFIKTTT